MKIFDHEKVDGGRHIAVLGILSLAWIGRLWVLRVLGLEICGIGWRMAIGREGGQQ